MRVMSEYIVVTSDIFTKYRAPRPNYLDTPERIHTVLKLLKMYPPLVKRLLFLEPKPVDEAEVLRVHTQQYLNQIKRALRSGSSWSLGEVYVSSELYEASLHVLGAGKLCADLVAEGKLRVGFVVARPPSHRAGKSRAGRYCLFNAVAYTAKYLLDVHEFKKVAILDLDLHHGDGTQEIFYDTSSVLFISIHEYSEFSTFTSGWIDELGRGDGEGFTINIPLPPGTAGDVYLHQLNTIVKPVLKQYKPEVLLVSMGFDTHLSDPSGDFLLSVSDYTQIATFLRDVVDESVERKCCIVFLEGGYNELALARGLVNMVSVLTGGREFFREERRSTSQVVRNFVKSTMRNLRKKLRNWWSL
ncbi:MAG: hypothetical protein DRJ40_00450 [Thermoprotei archaeon]|nr:MAG: hypothetical protein DRJ40_00450 [Thermoprotei archaeon]